MAIQTFTSGQVLTAAQVNALQTNDFNQTVSTKTVSYVLVAADKGTRVEMNAAGATTITVNTALFNAGDTLFIQNRGAGTTTITAGTATVSGSSLAVAQFQGGTLYFVSTGVAIFFLVGSSGVAALTDASVSGTTGSPTTGTYTDSGINYKFYKFTGSGSITTTKTGLVDVLVVAGGAGATGNIGFGAGAGGMVRTDNYYTVTGAQTITVGAAGSGGASRGGQSSINSLLTAVGGGFNTFNLVDSTVFGGSSGSKNSGSTTGQNIAGQGNIGAVGATGGGGGAGGAGGATAGGVGLADSITGASVTYATGGSSAGGVGTTNTGNGAGGSGANNGGSGIVVVRVLQ